MPNRTYRKADFAPCQARIPCVRQTQATNVAWPPCMDRCDTLVVFTRPYNIQVIVRLHRGVYLYRRVRIAVPFDRVHIGKQKGVLKAWGALPNRESFEDLCCSMQVNSSGGLQTCTLRVQVPKYEVYSPNHSYDSSYRNHIYPRFGYFGPLGIEHPACIVGASGFDSTWTLQAGSFLGVRGLQEPKGPKAPNAAFRCLSAW